MLFFFCHFKYEIFNKKIFIGKKKKSRSPFSLFLSKSAIYENGMFGKLGIPSNAPKSGIAEGVPCPAGIPTGVLKVP